jgi:GntR family transcriptional regulator
VSESSLGDGKQARPVRDDRPRHQQVAADLRAQIMSGDLAAGAQLPSTAMLKALYDAATATIQRALDMLKAEGFLTSRVGKGVYVRAQHPFVVDAAAYIAPAPGEYRYDLLSVDEIQPPADVARGLGLERSATAIRRSRLLLHNDIPVELSDSYYPADIAAGTALARPTKIRGGAPKLLTELGYRPDRFVDRISTRAPSTVEVETLALPSGTAVLRQLRVIYDEQRRPIEASVLIKGGHLYELSYQQDIETP